MDTLFCDCWDPGAIAEPSFAPDMVSVFSCVVARGGTLVGGAWGFVLVTYCFEAGTYEGVVMGAVVLLVETGSIGGLRMGPFSIQYKISLREE
jgi:hypothetical protein